MSVVFSTYVEWVRKNVENAASLERIMQMIVRIFTDPRNLILTELSWTVTGVHSFLNQLILTTQGRQITFAERIGIVSQLIHQLQCFVELLLRHHYGHEVTWNVLLVLQFVKCVLGVLMHRQLFLLPFVLSATRRWLLRLVDVLSRRAVAERTNAAATTALADSNDGAQLVIPRVAARRPRCDRTISANDRNGASSKCGESLQCTAVDFFGIVVDMLLLLRPLLLLYCARRLFPRGATNIAVLPRPRAADNGTNNGGDETGGAHHQSTAGKGQSDFFVVQSVLNDGVSRSLLSNWGVWLSFFGFDFVLVWLSSYIRQYRVPVVFISKENANNNFLLDFFTRKINGGLPTSTNNRGDDCNANNNSNSGNVKADDHLYGSCKTPPPVPPLPQSPMNKVVEQTSTIVSWDDLRMQKALRNLFFLFLHDPFFPAVIQRFVYDHFVVGRLNRIPLLGSILAYHVAYFLSKQHYSFMYLLE